MSEYKKKVVCVEDVPDIIDLVRLILGRNSFDLSSARGGQAGIDLIRRLRPDLVLLDLMTPDLGGWGTYHQLKADPELKNIPVIAVTPKVDEYVTRPFGPQELLQSMERVLGITM